MAIPHIVEKYDADLLVMLIDKQTDKQTTTTTEKLTCLHHPGPFASRGEGKHNVFPSLFIIDFQTLLLLFCTIMNI